MNKISSVTGKTLLAVILVLLVIWSSAALFFDARWAILSLLPPLALFTLLFYTRRLVHLTYGTLTAFLITLFWWLLIEPSHERPWLKDVALLPYAEVNERQITFHNVRNFNYAEPEGDHWITETLDLDKIVGVDMFLNFWGPTSIAHSLLSWEFSDGKHIAISIETRKEESEEYSAIRGFFRQFELYYVVSQEQDLIKVRNSMLGETSYLYRLNYSKEVAENLLLSYIKDINQLREHPEWYNAFSNNCTTSVRYNNQRLGNFLTFDWRILINGYLDELLYEQGVINTDLPFSAIRKASNITETSKNAPWGNDFHQAIRNKLPQRIIQ